MKSQNSRSLRPCDRRCSFRTCAHLSGIEIDLCFCFAESQHLNMSNQQGNEAAASLEQINMEHQSQQRQDKGSGDNHTVHRLSNNPLLNSRHRRLTDDFTNKL